MHDYAIPGNSMQTTHTLKYEELNLLAADRNTGIELSILNLDAAVPVEEKYPALKAYIR